MKDELKYILGSTYELQRFAEAKHAGLVVLNSAIIIGSLSIYKDHVFEKYSFIISIFFLGISILGSLTAQFPQTSKFLATNQNIANPNIYYFGDLSKINLQQFITEFTKSFASFNPDSSDKNIISQILANAKITSVKFSIFKFCIYTSTFGIGFLILATAINILKRL